MIRRVTNISPVGGGRGHPLKRTSERQWGGGSWPRGRGRRSSSATAPWKTKNARHHHHHHLLLRRSVWGFNQSPLALPARWRRRRLTPCGRCHHDAPSRCPAGHRNDDRRPFHTPNNSPAAPCAPWGWWRRMPGEGTSPPSLLLLGRRRKLPGLWHHHHHGLTCTASANP